MGVNFDGWSFCGLVVYDIAISIPLFIFMLVHIKYGFREIGFSKNSDEKCEYQHTDDDQDGGYLDSFE